MNPNCLGQSPRAYFPPSRGSPFLKGSCQKQPTIAFNLTCFSELNHTAFNLTCVSELNHTGTVRSGYYNASYRYKVTIVTIRTYRSSFRNLVPRVVGPFLRRAGPISPVPEKTYSYETPKYLYHQLYVCSNAQNTNLGNLACETGRQRAHAYTWSLLR